MADPFTYKAVGQKFGCGNEYANLTVVKFDGPGGARACAYSCNMNIDLDGEPQAYGPHFKPKIHPLDYLEDAGWLSQAANATKKAKYEDAKKKLEELEKKKTGLGAAPPTAPDPSKPAPDAKQLAAEKQSLDKHIAEARKAVHVLNPYPSTAPNYEKIFWHWYGLVALTPAEASTLVYAEKVGKTTKMRRPVLDKTSSYEDVHGKFPVVQSEYEPGPGYFVSPLATSVSPNFPLWDQRRFLPPDPDGQQAYAALSTPLTAATGLHLKDIVFAIHLDTGESATFPFLDAGYKPKVGECSVGAFTDLGGEVGPPKHDRPTYKNDFVVLYLAFPNSAGQTPAATLAKFATASNAADFPMILAFLAQATVDAKAKTRRGMITVGGDPLKEWEKWQKQKPEQRTNPSSFDTIQKALTDAGFKPATPAPTSVSAAKK